VGIAGGKALVSGDFVDLLVIQDLEDDREEIQAITPGVVFDGIFEFFELRGKFMCGGLFEHGLSFFSTNPDRMQENSILAVIARRVSDAVISKCLILLSRRWLRFARNDPKKSFLAAGQESDHDCSDSILQALHIKIDQ
jgi:hypothetical protein